MSMRIHGAVRWFTGCAVALVGLTVFVLARQTREVQTAQVGSRIGDVIPHLPYSDWDKSNPNPNKWTRFRQTSTYWLYGTGLEFHVETKLCLRSSHAFAKREAVYYFTNEHTNALKDRLASVSSQWRWNWRGW